MVSDDDTFNDYDDDPDDGEALESYAAAITAAVLINGIEVLEPGEQR